MLLICNHYRLSTQVSFVFTHTTYYNYFKKNNNNNKNESIENLAVNLTRHEHHEQ